MLLLLFGLYCCRLNWNWLNTWSRTVCTHLTHETHLSRAHSIISILFHRIYVVRFHPFVYQISLLIFDAMFFQRFTKNNHKRCAVCVEWVCVWWIEYLNIPMGLIFKPPVIWCVNMFHAIDVLSHLFWLPVNLGDFSLSTLYNNARNILSSR